MRRPQLQLAFLIGLIAWIALGGHASAQPAPTPQDAVGQADSSPLPLALDAFAHARQSGDAAAMAKFFYADNDPAGRFALANANRILAAAALEQAIKQHITPTGGDNLVANFGLTNEPFDHPEGYPIHEHGDIAMEQAGNPMQPQSAWFKKIDGVWKIDITPPPPANAADRAMDMELDNPPLARITTQINDGKIKSLIAVRDALGQAMLNAQPDPMFARDMRIEGVEPLPPPHDRPDPHGQFPISPATPAGAMNRFVQALEKSDEATLSDVTYMPEDTDGSARAAAAHHFIAGMHLVSAAESKFSGEDNLDGQCLGFGVVTRNALRGYTDDEWAIEPNYPDLAMGSSDYIPNWIVSNGQKMFVKEFSWVPIMHHCPDGIWRMGPRFPQNARQLHAQATAWAKKAAILEQAAADIRSGKYATTAAAEEAVAPSLQLAGGVTGAARFPN